MKAIGLHTAVELAYGFLAEQRLDLYRQVERVGEPEHTRPLVEPRPLLIWFHGGGWVRGNRQAQLHHLMPFLVRGWHVATVGYRKGPGTAPQAVLDAHAAVRWVSSNVAELGFACDRLIVGGSSAGGHLALCAGFDTTDVPIDGVLNVYGITDLERLDHYFGEGLENNYLRLWTGGRSPTDLAASYSPVELARSDSPQVITIHGDADTVVPVEQAAALHMRLDELGVRNRLLTLEGGNHGGFTAEQLNHALESVFEFLMS